MNLTLQRATVTAGFVFMVIVLLVNTYVIQRQLRVQAQSQSWVVHSREVRLATERLELLMEDAETGQRGFLLTGDAVYLGPYTAALAKIHPQIERLGALTADNSQQQANLARVRAIADHKLDEMDQTLGLYRAGEADKAKALVESDSGLHLMNEFRSEIAQMEEEEARLESERDRDYETSRRITVACVYLATALAGIGLLLLANFMIRERRIRERYTHDLSAREERFRVTLTSIGDAVIATDAAGSVNFLNPMAEKLIGVKFGEVAGQQILNVFPIFNEVSGNPAENPVSKVMQLGVVVGLANHTVLKHRDGHLIPIEDSAAPIRDDQGEMVGTVLVFRDVTADRNAQEVLRKTEKLAAAARLSATVAHEINNPLEAVINLIYIAKACAADLPEVVQHLTLAEQELDRVAHITRQTLGFYRDSNQPEEIELASVVDSVLKLYSNKIAAKGLRVERHVSDCPKVWGATGELKQVVSNLVSNAIDATPNGGQIAILCSRDESQDRLQATLLIEDSGAGVPTDLRLRIFDPFFTTKEDVGTGLGLWVTKEIVDRHGGSILLREAAKGGLPGAGFVIRIPAYTGKPGEPKPFSHD